MSSDKPKKKMHPNSLANLRAPAQPGEVRNPNGGRTHNPYVKGLKKITSQVYADMIEFALNNNLTELRKIARDPETSAIKVGVAKVLIKNIEEANWGTLNAIIERLVGKPPQEFRFEGNLKTNVDLSKFSEEDLLTLRNVMLRNAPPAEDENESSENSDSSGN